MKPRDYCCCAIPIVNAGIYITLTEQFATALIVGILSLATTSIVGAATPSFSPLILAILCFIAAGIQVLGFIGVVKERATLYRRYVSLHMLITLAVFAVAAAWIIISASRHSTAKSKCLTDFFSSGDSSQVSEGDTLCEIFSWVDVGIMGGLWVVLGIFHAYLYIVLSSYGSSQRRDHEKYDQLNNDAIPMNKRNDPWDSRLSSESPRSPSNRVDRGYNHLRQESAASISDVMTLPQQLPQDALSNPNYGYQQGSYPNPHQNYIDRRTSVKGTQAYPAYTYAQDPAYSDDPYGVGASYLGRSPSGQAHPVEGSFGRKTSRLTKAQRTPSF